MDNQWWSWILTVVGVGGFLLAGRKVWWSWYINLGCQALWFAYAFITEQYGFIFAAVVYTFVFTKNAIAWTKEHFARRRQEEYLSTEEEQRYQQILEDRKKNLISPNEARRRMGITEFPEPRKDTQ